MKDIARTGAGAFCLLIALLSLVAPVAAFTWITGPTVITEPGEYRLANDIVNSDAPACIDIVTSGVTIDGRGHLIDGVRAPGSVGIRDSWSPGADASNGGATIIENVRFTDWGSAVWLHKVVGRSIQRCTFEENGVGVDADVTDGAVVSSCTFTRNGDGVGLSGASNAVVRDNTFSANTRGIVVGALLRCYAVTISSNVIDGSTDAGILIDWTGASVTIRENRITNSGRVGIDLGDFPGIVITDNYLSNSNNVDVDTVVTPANTWSREPAKGKNIVSGRRLGGNYWAKPDGTGFSQVTPDANRDGFCDAPYAIADLNVDRYPLRAK